MRGEYQSGVCDTVTDSFCIIDTRHTEEFDVDLPMKMIFQRVRKMLNVSLEMVRRTSVKKQKIDKLS